MSQITARLPDELAELDRAARQVRRTRGCIERFNGKLRDEFLNEHWFEMLIRPGARAMQLDPLQTPRRSIKLATPDFLNSVDASGGGQVRDRELTSQLATRSVSGQNL